jgi:mono/diheme cytochrome c family protein
MRWWSRQVSCLLAIFVVLALLPARGAEPAKLGGHAPMKAFFDSYCMSCHDAATKKGGFDLENLAADFADPGLFEKWVKVHDRIRAGEMPPKEKKNRPTPAEADAVVTALNAGLSDAERARRGAAGRASFRRLNRTEYENTLRDLLSLPGLAVRDMLPEDGQAFGFDKSASGLDLSYVQLAKYMEAADAALDAAIAPHAERPAVFKVHIPGTFQAMAAHAFNGQTVFLKDFKYDDTVTAIPTEREAHQPQATKVKRDLQKHPYAGTIGVFRADDAEFKPKFPFVPVTAGKYKIRMSVWSFMWDKGEVKPNPRTEAGALITGGRTLGYFDAPSLKPTVTEIEVWLDVMEEFHFNAASLWPALLGGNVAAYVRPGIAIDWLEIEGPILDQWPTASHRRLFGDLPFVALPSTPRQKGGKKKGMIKLIAGDSHIPKRPPENAYVIRGHDKPYITNFAGIPQHFEPATIASTAPESDARRLLADFLPRAFRRPVPATEVESYVELFEERTAEGDMFEMAMRTAYKAALCSPNFLFLKESSGEPSAAGALTGGSVAPKTAGGGTGGTVVRGELEDSSGKVPPVPSPAESLLSPGPPVRAPAALSIRGADLTRSPRGPLDNWAVASRLSYFLWNSMPDDELFALAEQGKLHDGVVLHRQVERMLQDAKAQRFVVDFTNQWLDLAEIDSTTPDKKLYPEFRPILHDSMLAETRGFFRELLDKDLSAINIVHSDFAMLNQRLAEHYRIPGVVGSAIRRVTLPGDCSRGGFLTQAGVLKVTANGTVTSPVKRGAWVMRKIIGQPPDPPPPDVPAIEPDIRGTTTVREMLAKHRASATCAACHAKIDPPGFALESFDVIGGLQTRYRSLSEEGDEPDKSQTFGRHVQYKWGQKVDSSGQMADGRTFGDIGGFKKLLLQDPRLIARNFVRQLTTYATGTPIGFSDRAAVERILDRTAAGQYGMRSLIHEVVQSDLFQSK